jgi:hypothetical protein
MNDEKNKNIGSLVKYTSWDDANSYHNSVAHGTWDMDLEPPVSIGLLTAKYDEAKLYQVLTAEGEIELVHNFLLKEIIDEA